MLEVKIIGAGSIGNHLANACRHLNWNVVVCDDSSAAIDRMRTTIYPSRYGSWDESIGLYNSKDVPVRKFDIIMIGTPPDSHMPLALEAIAESPRALFIEKPVCTPDLEHAQELVDLLRDKNIMGFVGYDHVVSQATRKVEELIRSKVLGEARSIDVEFREHWQGILNAHPWLQGPWDSYLGFWKRGGGACGEHSHGINLFEHFARLIGAGRIVGVSSLMKYNREKGMEYDEVSFLNVTTESGLIGRIVQDVISLPVRKRARIICDRGSIEWICGYRPGIDAVREQTFDGRELIHEFNQSRRDDFIEEMRHVQNTLEGTTERSPIDLRFGLDTMLTISASHSSAHENTSVFVDHRKGYRKESLTVNSRVNVP